MKHLLIGSIALAALSLGACASEPAPTTTVATAAAPQAPAPAKMAGMAHYHAMLAPEAGVTSAGKGMGMFMYEPATHTLSYEVTYDGITGTMAHIHGPTAAPGGKAGVAVPFASAASPIKGTATLTDAQAADLAAGKYYVNIHTAAAPGGEIRGTILPE